MKKLIPLVLALGLFAPSLATAAEHDKFKVVTTFTIIADMARNVAGDAAIVESITKPGAEIHDYSPTPGDLRRARGADLILWNGLNLERWFERFFARIGDVPSATVSEGVAPISINEGPYDGKPNPHAWLSETEAVRYVENMRDALMEHDPDNAETYGANAAAYIAEIQETMAPLRELLDDVPDQQRWLVTSEGAFSYLARDLGLKELFLWPINADAQGTPQQVRNVIDTVREQGITVVFSESTISQDAAQQVARETGASYGGVLYVDSLSEADGPVPTFLDLLTVTTTTIAEGLTVNKAVAMLGGGVAEVDGLRVSDVAVTYRNGHRALDGASFDIPKGSITALVGINGSGKSTLFKAIMGFVPLSRGRVDIFGRPGSRALKENRVAYVPQAEEVDWDFPILVEDVVMMGRYGHMGILRRASEFDRKQVDQALERVGLTELRKRQIGELSGGQKKRVFLARALAQEGDIILLDEPFTGVDVTTEEQIIALLRALRDEGKVMLVSTHNLGSVPEFCDRAVLINRTVITYGPTEEVFTPSNLERAFGGVLRHFVLSGSDLHDDEDAREVRVITDDERPFVLYGERDEK